MRGLLRILFLTCAVAAGAASPAAAQGVEGERPRCFGAASRDPSGACVNPALDRAVTPTPSAARTLGPAPCKPVGSLSGRLVCSFGAPARGARTTVALVGDSHAGHLRAAVEVVARRENWHGLSLTHASCPLSRAVRVLPERARDSCERWRAALFAWLAQHPEITTVFVSQLSGGSGVVASGGRGPFETAVSGYIRAWNALPASVQRVVVIRDTPKVLGSTDDCVERAMAHGAVAGMACAVPRSAVLTPDPAFVAAGRTRAARVRSVDLTRYFCDRRKCFPVVGGVLTHKDSTHITPLFAETLGPYLQRAVAGS